MSWDLTGIGKILEVTKNDKWYNIIWKLILWLAIVTYIIFLSLHIFAYFSKSQYSNFLGWEVNKYRPCIDTTVIHDTTNITRVVKDTVYITRGKSGPEFKDSKNVNTGVNLGQIGDNIFNSERMLTQNDLDDLLVTVKKFFPDPSMQEKRVYIALHQSSNLARMASQISEALSKKGYKTSTATMFSSGPPPKGVNINGGTELVNGKDIPYVNIFLGAL